MFDLSIYDHVQAQLGPDDKVALLTVFAAVRRHLGTYTYLEIGSWQGGSLQPIVADPACVRAYSFDARKGGPKYETWNASRMRANLARVPGADPEKLHCFDRAFAGGEIGTLTWDAVDVAFIDGWHTPDMAWRDFEALRANAEDEPLPVFLWHDVDMIATAFKRAHKALPGSVAYRLSDKVGMIYAGDWAAFATPELLALCKPMRWGRATVWWAIRRRWRRFTPEALRAVLAPVATWLKHKVAGL